MTRNGFQNASQNTPPLPLTHPYYTKTDIELTLGPILALGIN